jgi:membrane protein
MQSDDGRRSYSRRDFGLQLAARSLAEYLDDNCPQLAASIAYHVLFALFPLAIVLAGIFGIVVHTTGARADVIDTIVRAAPLSASGASRLRNLLNGATSGLSALGLLGAIGLVWSASGMMGAIRVALNQAWDAEDARPFLKGKLVDVGLVFGVALVSLASLGLTIAVRFIGAIARHGAVVLGGGWVTWILGVLVPLALSFGTVVALYRLVPAAHVRLAEAWPAALLVACGFVVAQNLFALYVGHFANYNAVYGSLGAVIAFMFFVYLASSLFLLGAEVASEWPRTRSALERGEVGEGPPFPQQVKEALEGLWVQRRQDEAGAGSGGSGGGAAAGDEPVRRERDRVEDRDDHEQESVAGDERQVLEHATDDRSEQVRRERHRG